MHARRALVLVLLALVLLCRQGDAKIAPPAAGRLAVNAKPGTASSVAKQAHTGNNHNHEHKMSIRTLVTNVVADLCPHGMLPLAYGISQGGPTGVVPALLLMAVFGAMSAFTMTSFASLAEQTKSNSIGELWAKLLEKRTKWIAEAAVFSLCFGCCVFYSAFVGDIFGALASAVGLTGLLAKRWIVLLLISTFCLLPLCLLEDLSALQFSSVLGVGGIASTLLFHVKRFLDGTYAVSKDPKKRGVFLASMSSKMQPANTKLSLFNINAGVLVLVNMLCVAYLAHYNAINYYKELENATPARYRLAIGTGFGIAFSVFAGMMLLGYSLFGSAAQPLVLNNFHRTADLLATGARFATGLAITFAYPLMFAGLKSSLFALLPNVDKVSNANKKNDNKNIKAVVGLSQETKNLRFFAVIAALGSITAIACKCGEEDVSLVLGIVGSVLGCGVAYVLPGVLGLQQAKARKAAGLKNSPLEVLVNHLLVALGTIFGALGVAITIYQEQQHKHHKH